MALLLSCEVRLREQAGKIERAEDMNVVNNKPRGVNFNL
jgi:hypothetical protein